MYSVYILLLTKQKKKKRIWARDWILRCDLGIHKPLLSELKTEDPRQLGNFLRMTAEDFDYLLELVGLIITKSNTKMRCAITASERLCLTLKFLAIGKNILYNIKMYFFGYDYNSHLDL